MINIYIGWDPLDVQAYEVCARSLRAHATIPVNIIPLREWELRQKGLYWRSYRVDSKGQKWDDRDGKPFSTQFSFTRFAVPLLENHDSEWALFCDPDMLWRADIADLIAQADPSKAVTCVKHDHRPPEGEKMIGQIQTHYHRKNWSSLMLFRPWRNRGLTKYALNNMTGAWLHALCWLKDDEIGALDPAWNWLEGWSDPSIDPKIAHFTRGTPDMPGHEDAPYADEWRAALIGRQWAAQPDEPGLYMVCDDHWTDGDYDIIDYRGEPIGANPRRYWLGPLMVKPFSAAA